MANSQVADNRLVRYRAWRENSAVYFRWQVEQFAGFLGPRLADIGCGAATLTPYLADRELYLGIDSDPAMLAEVERLSQQFPAVRTLCIDATSQDCARALREARIDTVFSANTIEHIENDRAALVVMSEALLPGGHICLLVPAFQILYGTLDSLDGHFRRYTQQLLRARITGLPLNIRRMHYFNAVGALGWFVKGRLLRVHAQEESDYRTMSRIVPLVRPIEAMIHPPIGLSLIAVLERQA